MSHPIALLVSLTLLVQAARASNLTIPPVADGPIDGVIPVLAAQARCVAVSDAHGWLAFGHRLQRPDTQVSLFHLGEDGKPVGEAIALKLPRPEPLVKYPQYVLGLAFHPTKPLLYVLQDLEVPKNEQRMPLPLVPAEEAAVQQFDHLVIYRLDGDRPVVLVSLCRGPTFSVGRPHGGIGIDPTAERIYVPNIRNPKALAQSVAGCYGLDADGLPYGREALGEGKTIAERIGALEQSNAAGTPLQPRRVTPFTQEVFESDIPLGLGYGFVHIARDFVMFGGAHTSGIVTWQPENAQARLHGFLLPNSYRNYAIYGHPRLSVVYVADPGTPWAWRFEHADGYLTLVPQKITVAGLNLASGPVVREKLAQVVFGGTGCVVSIGLDAEGRFTTQRSQMKLDVPMAEAVGYSAKHDRVYVAVEKLP